MDKEEELYQFDSHSLPAPGAKYGSVSESIRRNIPEARLCAMFCGGKNCKYEDTRHWPEELQAVKGLYSSWVTNNILAMSRPNTEMVKKFKIIDQFKKFKIRSIVNLQKPGEHNSCGPTLEPSGFSYEPQHFMDAGVSFYNFGWKDYGFGTMSNIVDMVRVMQFAVTEGKVAVHCHAGLGRTGVFIACYLIYSNRLSANDAIQYVRSKRPGTIQTKSQITAVQEFAAFLTPMRVIFSCVGLNRYKDHCDFTLSQFISRQKYLIHGWEARKLKYLPKIIYTCCERLLELANRSCNKDEHKNQLFILNRLGSTKSDDTSSSDTIKLFSSRYSTETIREELDLSVLHYSVSLESFTPIRPSRRGRFSPPLPGEKIVNDDKASVAKASANEEFYNSKKKKKAKELYSLPANEQVARAMALPVSKYSEDLRQRMLRYKEDLNSSSAVWSRLRKESDAILLSALMWDWIDHLQQPILGSQDLPAMLAHPKDPIRGLSNLERAANQTIFYLFYTLTCVCPIPSGLKTELLQRTVSTLTHQNMAIEMDDEADEASAALLWTSNDVGLMRSTLAGKLHSFFTSLMATFEHNYICECIDRQ